ncbi:uncharacterized protein CANTADRAFT_262970 [Suhomyces tanzawaensis NRRL Y-17324]|uniref:Uncharacterized protein n=1 Tax=Suhomyces tanzawaensis NRRL Y-17324 TaxID=984487 RepID=A0A1E4SFV8_9ASCO|nr:uncharacterized protein CANTADRAFT_262970 [Suhomyces tanzawaensis NRRL Y-17324]ODV78292.1 hypothetical protein CANTADRAFT_262970 [Suhomyces tanzawaensis NRRL Y-17324]
MVRQITCWWSLMSAHPGVYGTRMKEILVRWMRRRERQGGGDKGGYCRGTSGFELTVFLCFWCHGKGFRKKWQHITARKSDQQNQASTIFA